MVLQNSEYESGKKASVHIGSNRIHGIDLARMLAIFGMMAVHLAPDVTEHPYKLFFALPAGRASILFVLIAGIGVSILAASRTVTPKIVRLQLAWRAALLLPVGLLLQELGHEVWVILQHYSLFFLLGILTFQLPDRKLLITAMLAGVLGPLIYFFGQIYAVDVFNMSAVAISDPADKMAHGLVLSGPYPLITYSAPFLLGIWLGRLNMRMMSVRYTLIVSGLGVFLLVFGFSTIISSIWGNQCEMEGWTKVLCADPHSQMLLWLIGGTAAACLMLGLSLILADTFSRYSWPFVVTGQLPLTIYVVHLLDLHWRFDTLNTYNSAEAFFSLLTMFVIAIVFSSVWRWKFKRGPLEEILNNSLKHLLNLLRSDNYKNI